MAKISKVKASGKTTTTTTTVAQDINKDTNYESYMTNNRNGNEKN